ncbi:MAG: FG-GAP-like repeat-containing protein, partial [Rhodothermales bacterium]|nr:FG-GAP-like repeat-containing protein [Rhodothermales bacterium]
TDVTDEAGLQSTRASTTATLADVDGDGDLDLYIANYKVRNALDAFEPGELSALMQQLNSGGEIPPKLEKHFHLWRVNNEWMREERAEADWLYLNDGTGKFESVDFTSGRFRDERGDPLTQEPEYFGLAARFYDVDDDGDPDLYVCNDFGSPDQFWINDGTGTFHAAPPLALRSTSHASMAVDFADVDRDGDVDFYVVDMLSRNLPGRKTRALAHEPLFKDVGEVSNRPQMQRNTLFVNRGDGTYAQVSDLAGLEASDWSWSTLFLDADLDGYEDILVATGYTWDVYDHDTFRRLPAQSSMINWREIRLLYPDLYQKNIAFRNKGDLTFEDVSEAWGFGTEPDISHGFATADLDGDGDLDVIVNRLGSPVGVFRNDVNEKRLSVRLIGDAPNTQAIGAKIRVRGGPVPEQKKEVTLGGLYLSNSEPLYTFAAGNADQLTIVVEWRSGERTVVEAVPNRLYEIREPAPSQGASRKMQGDPAIPPADAPFFIDVSSTLGHTHIDAGYDDYGRQPLLPNKLSQLGPGVSWYDVDRDGDEDLLIATGTGGRFAYYRNEAGRFRSVSLGLPAARYDQTTVLAQPDGAGGTTLLIGQAAWEAASRDEALGTASVLQLTLRSGRAILSTAVPGTNSSVGPLAQADIDGDGDLDLFVGGRVIPAAYPIAPSSRLFLNRSGSFELDRANSQVFSQVGLVSAAVFSDIDGDGDPDLVLALE